MVSYRVMPGVPPNLVRFVSGLLAARRREIGTRKGTRRLGCYRQALFGLAWFRDKGDIPRLGAGFGPPQSTAYLKVPKTCVTCSLQSHAVLAACLRRPAVKAARAVLRGGRRGNPSALPDDTKPGTPS